MQVISDAILQKPSWKLFSRSGSPDRDPLSFSCVPKCFQMLLFTLPVALRYVPLAGNRSTLLLFLILLPKAFFFVFPVPFWYNLRSDFHLAELPEAAPYTNLTNPKIQSNYGST